MLNFTRTNECLESVMAGMKPKQDDSILAVCGSGDLPFALVEYAGFVCAVDNNPVQIEYAQRRASYLRVGDVKSFLHVRSIQYAWTFIQKRNNYFLKKGRLTKIKHRLDKIQFKIDDLINVIEDGRFSKVYLSNVFHPNHISGYSKICETMQRITSSLSEGGLVYLASQEYIDNEKEQAIQLGIEWPQQLVLDRESTETSLRLENSSPGIISWSPAIYRKVS